MSDQGYKNVKTLCIEAAVCAIAFVVTKSVFIVNGLILMFAVWNISQEIMRAKTINTFKGISSLFMGVSCLITIWLNNIVFLQWKASITVILFSLFVLFSPKLIKQPALKIVISQFFNLEKEDILFLNTLTGIFLFVLSLINLVLATTYNEHIWMYFKTLIMPYSGLLFSAFIFISYFDKIKEY